LIAETIFFSINSLNLSWGDVEMTKNELKELQFYAKKNKNFPQLMTPS
jgi:hypothetical protein